MTQYQNHTQEDINLLLLQSCANGCLEDLRFFLFSPELAHQAQPQTRNNLGFRLACQNGHLECVKYLLDCPDITPRPDIHSQNDYAMKFACLNDYLQVVECLLEKMNIPSCLNQRAMELALVYAVQRKYDHIILKIIFDGDIYWTQNLAKKLENNPYVLELFARRTLHQALQDKLPRIPTDITRGKV